MYHDPRTPPNSYTRLNPTMTSVEKNTKPSQEHQTSHRDWYSEVQFRPIHDHGVMIMNRSPSPARSPSRPLLSHRPLSPETRAQAIARGRSELMEMVKNMPELNYELSLKDIVENHRKNEDDQAQKRVVKMKEEEGRRVERNLSFENKGLFLNMVFPFSFRSRRRRRKSGGGNSGRVSPAKVAGERDLWKKKLRGSSDSDSSRSSDNSGASSSTVSSGGATVSSGGGDEHERRRYGFTRGCFQFFNSRRRIKFAE